MARSSRASCQAATAVATPRPPLLEVAQQAFALRLPCRRYSTTADIWSTGIMLLELAAGRPPLSRCHTLKVMLSRIRDPAPQLEDPNGRFSKV
jgi:serine/threonine protein kinase